MKFSLVMPCHKCENHVKKAIESILDQDYKDWELICVVNGEWSGRKKTIKIIEKYTKKDQRIRLIEQEEGNPCSARNLGAAEATGEYISFFSCDFYMFPGALRKWEQTFKAQTHADFIYSHYRLMKEGKLIEGQVYSRPFDAWELQMENYIDGGFPMKREVWEKGKWDPEIKSLNDWDFWLTAIDNGFVGYFMPDITYAAEVPKEGGLSYDSAQHWLERNKQIKDKHNIPIRDICVVSLGAVPHGKKIAKLLDADFKYAPQFKPHNYKAIYLIGYYFGNGESAMHHSAVFKDHKGVKIIHWIGTDILQLIVASGNVCYRDLKILIDAMENCENLTEFEQTHGELLSMGLKNQIVPLPVESNLKATQLPKDFTLATYVPRTPTASQIYNLDLVKDIIKACPDIKWTIFGGGDIGFKRKNIENVGWTDMQNVIDKSSCLLRLTYHDGLPIAPIEFKMAGRDAITTVNIPYCFFAGTGIIHAGNFAERKEKVINLIRLVKKEQRKNGIKNKKKAQDYYKELTSPEKFRTTIRKIINERITANNSKVAKEQNEVSA